MFHPSTSAIVTLLTLALAVSQAIAEESRAAGWLRQDQVQPVADLLNQAKPGEAPNFVDHIGQFTVSQDADALVVRGTLPPNIWRFDYTTFDGQFDLKAAYVPGYQPVNPDPNSLWSAALRERFGDAYVSATGPWDIYNGLWAVPTARVSLDGRHVYTNWFDLPGIEDQAAGRAYASFALDIREPGPHEVRIAFAPFRYNTRASRADRPVKAEVQVVPNPLKPTQIASIAIGVDERARSLRRIPLKPELAGKHPRMPGRPEAANPTQLLPIDSPRVQQFLTYLDPDRGENWEYSISEESMASDNDMDMGKKLGGAARTYDQLVPELSPEAKKAVDEMFIKRADGFYTFCVFQRNYHPTGYAQNHASCAQGGLLLAGLAFDGPLAEKWLDWAVALYSKRVELLGKDGSVEFMNESRNYGLGFWQSHVDILREMTGVNLATGPFFENEWRFALHQSPSFSQYAYAKFPVPIPTTSTPENTPTNWHFHDVDQVFMRSDWSDRSYRLRFWCGPPFGHSATDRAKRFNFAHYQVNQGSITLTQGAHEILLEPNATRDYRKSATGANTMIINRTDQWGGGQVWHPRLAANQYGHIAVFADDDLLSVARGDLKDAYPPSARVNACSRIVVHLKPAHFVVFDSIQTQTPGEVEWRFHSGFIDPAEVRSRFSLFAARPGPRGAPPDQAFLRVPEATVRVACLYPPDTRPTLGDTEMFYRWKPGRPARHVKATQKAEDGNLCLLTAWGPDLGFESKDPKGASFQWTQGTRQWNLLIGPGKVDGFESDARFTVAVVEMPTRRAAIYRWGGRSLVHGTTRVERQEEDVFAVLAPDAPTRTVVTRPP